MFQILLKLPVNYPTQSENWCIRDHLWDSLWTNRIQQPSISSGQGTYTQNYDDTLFWTMRSSLLYSLYEFSFS